ncbi:MAG: hypothetical protein ACRD8Z_17120 [Nitrososphaeraceae archaeon]
MTIELLHHRKLEIISRWLKGEQRDRIAADLGLGAGTVSAMISEWRSQIGIPEADALEAIFNRAQKSGDYHITVCFGL